MRGRHETEPSATRRPIHFWAKPVEVGSRVPSPERASWGRQSHESKLVPYRLILSIAALTAAVLAPPAQAGIGPQVTHFTLSNGLEVVVIPDHRAPVVTHMVWYKVGSADETPRQVGAAPLPPQPPFHGTGQNPPCRPSLRPPRPPP